MWYKLCVLWHLDCSHVFSWFQDKNDPTLYIPDLNWASDKPSHFVFEGEQLKTASFIFVYVSVYLLCIVEELDIL